jgi:hypothetical protein
MDETKEILSKLLDLAQRKSEAMKPPVPIVPLSIVVTTSCHDKYNKNTNSTTTVSTMFADENRIVLHIDATVMSKTGGNNDDCDRHHPVPRLEGTVLHPGSLRKRGEYCLVQFQVVPDDNNSKTTSSYDMFHWQVTSVDFRRMGDAAVVR